MVLLHLGGSGKTVRAWGFSRLGNNPKPQICTHTSRMARAFTLRGEIVVRAPMERCFLLSTSVEIVERELGMRPVAGRTSGLVVEGDVVRWEGWQLGLPQFHESRIEDFRPLTFFRDRMIAGRFASFEHNHNFTDQGDGSVLLWDVLQFTMRWGWAGEILGRWVLVPHIRRLMRTRFTLLKQIAESEEWRRYLPDVSVRPERPIVT